MQVLAGYGTVTALIMNAALRLYSSTKFPKSDKMSTKFFNTLFIAVTALCVTSGGEFAQTEGTAEKKHVNLCLEEYHWCSHNFCVKSSIHGGLIQHPRYLHQIGIGDDE